MVLDIAESLEGSFLPRDEIYRFLEIEYLGKIFQDFQFILVLELEEDAGLSLAE